MTKYFISYEFYRDKEGVVKSFRTFDSIGCSASALRGELMNISEETKVDVNKIIVVAFNKI